MAKRKTAQPEPKESRTEDVVSGELGPGETLTVNGQSANSAAEANAILASEPEFYVTGSCSVCGAMVRLGTPCPTDGWVKD
jgi:hypothetical protein